MERSVKTEVAMLDTCPGCKAEVRNGSEYCYNCGNKLPLPDKVMRNPPSVNVDGTPKNGSIVNGPGVNSQKVRTGTRGARMRRPHSAEPVQVVWRRKEDVEVSFLLLTAAAAFFAVLLIAVAYYLR